MSETIEVPKIGSIKKSQLFAVAGIGGGIVLYAWWRARSAVVSDEVAPEPEDPYQGLTNSGGGGAVSGYPSGDSSSDTKTTAPRTNAEWSQLAAEKLVASYEPQVIDAALGRFLGRQPLTTLDQEVVRAAIARAGYPPEGGPWTVISGGNTDITVPPGNPTATQSGSTIVVRWGAVPGAASYYVYRSDQGGPTVASGTSATLHHIDAGFTYKIQVAAVSGSGKVGPKSAQIQVKAVGPKLTAPKIGRVTPAKTSVTVAWSGVKGAEIYRLYVNGSARGAAEKSPYTIGGLKPNTTYKITVKADASGVSPGPASNTVTTKTKK